MANDPRGTGPAAGVAGVSEGEKVTNLVDRLRAYGDGETDKLSRMDALEAANLIAPRASVEPEADPEPVYLSLEEWQQLHDAWQDRRAVNRPAESK